MIEVLPLEIISLVISNLADDDHSVPSLKACSLTCQTLLPICQREIFHTVILRDQSTKSTFVELIQQSPQLIEYVRELTYFPTPEDYLDTSGSTITLSSLLQRFKKLRTIVIEFPLRSNRQMLQDWQQLSTAMRSTLLYIIRLPLITSVGLKNIRNFDFFDLFLCAGLRVLKLHEVSLMEWDTSATNQARFAVKSIQLRKLILTDRRSKHKKIQPSFEGITKFLEPYRDGCLPILDLRGLTEVVIGPVVEMGVSNQIIRNLRSLESITLGFSYRRSNMKLVVPSILASLKTLSQLSLRPRRYHPLNNTNLKHIVTSVSDVLKSIACDNVISVLTLDFNFVSPTPCWCGSVWHRLEGILLGAGWQRLMQFDLKVNFSSAGNDTALVDAIQKLPERYFPGLSSSSSIKFSFGIDYNLRASDLAVIF